MSASANRESFKSLNSEEIPTKTDESSEPTNIVTLKKQLGLGNGIGIIVGVIVGSGIFVSPKGVLLNAGSVGLSLIIWMSTGLLSLCGALCYAELGTSIPKSGGEFAYLNEAFGPLAAFLYLWVALFIIMPTGNAIIGLTFAEYILQPFYANCEAPEHAVKLIAVAVILFLTFVNCYNVKWATCLQDCFAFAKIIALVIIISAGIGYLIFGSAENLSKPFAESSWNFADISLAFYSGMFSFSGWNSLNFVTEELKHPTRDLPRAIYISLPLVSFIYFLTNVAYFSVLTRSEILASNAVAGAFGDKILGMMAWVMPLCVAMSTFGGLNGGIFSSARLFFVGARQGHLPSIVSMININHLTPSPSLIFLCLITIFYLYIGSIYVLINFTSFIEALFLTMTTGALVYLRIKDPHRHRPIKVNMFFPIAFLLIGTLLVVLPFYKNVVETGTALLITISGIPFYLLFVRSKSKPTWIVSASDSTTRLIQKLLVCSPQEKVVDSPSESVFFSDSIGTDKVE
ncbi:Y+L amino acid transporter 2-like [Uloborus diversus]|uniref:Y+L amino acid transporter 2-like n=1 Tax=Uloborus diversus TaxID=327109 RepID=UPI0024098008|nr:Y+L amino acid transporter 2-like [Uloborus diversus]